MNFHPLRLYHPRHRSTELLCSVLRGPAVPVHGEVLKAKDIEQPNGSPDTLVLEGGRPVNGSVDLFHDPYKEPSVDSLKMLDKIKTKT